VDDSGKHASIAVGHLVSGGVGNGRRRSADSFTSVGPWWRATLERSSVWTVYWSENVSSNAAGEALPPSSCSPSDVERAVVKAA
jgi:hypothetical protein